MTKSIGLTQAWLEAVTGFQKPGSSQRGLLVKIDDFDACGLPIEIDGFQSRLDSVLKERGEPSVGETARTIFPFSHSAVKAASSRQDLYARYEQIIPSIREHKLNKNGVYFERMIMFPAHDTPKDLRVNQLENLISFWEENGRRKSAFQVCIFQPKVDWTREPYAKFPCLQHVVFTPLDGQLHVSAFYATQYLIKRGYGNYLGLCRLGAFMAHEMKIQMGSLACYAAHAPLEVNKRDLQTLLKQVTGA